MANLLGYAASCAVLATFLMRTMVPLRLVAILSNFLFLSYGYVEHIYPVLFLHAVLLPINLWRLLTIQLPPHLQPQTGISDSQRSLGQLKALTRAMVATFCAWREYDEIVDEQPRLPNRCLPISARGGRKSANSLCAAPSAMTSGGRSRRGGCRYGKCARASDERRPLPSHAVKILRTKSTIST